MFKIKMNKSIMLVMLVLNYITDATMVVFMVLGSIVYFTWAVPNFPRNWLIVLSVIVLSVIVLSVIGGVFEFTDRVRNSYNKAIKISS